MINQILEVIANLDGLISALIAGAFTFLITKYNYHKNIPLDKYEIAYNRVYYPIYCVIKSDMSLLQRIETCEVYLKKYKKYVDGSTLRAFQYLKDSINEGDEKKAYTNFANNIYAMDTKLRRRLGYLEPNIFTMYTYSTPSDKRLVRLLFEIVGTYIPAIISPSVNNEKVLNILTLLLLVSMIALIIEGIIWLCQVIEKCILDIRSAIKRNRLIRKSKNSK